MSEQQATELSTEDKVIKSVRNKFALDHLMKLPPLLLIFS
jgi:hypothetical protein